jgi:hypothetical protein
MLSCGAFAIASRGRAESTEHRDYVSHMTNLLGMTDLHKSLDYFLCYRLSSVSRGLHLLIYACYGE